MCRNTVVLALITTAAILMYPFCAFADAVYLKDGRVIKGDIQEETLDLLRVFETDTLWRVSIYKHLIEKVEQDGVVYTNVKRGELMRPAPAAVSVEHLPSSKPAMAVEPAKTQVKTIQIKQDEPATPEKKSNPISAWFKSLFGGGSGKKE